MIDQRVAAFRAVVGVLAPGSLQVTDLVTALIGLEAARTSQLDRLERKIDDVRDAPFRRGRALLQEALDVGENVPDTLRRAVDKFEEAHATYEREPDFSFWAALYVSTLRDALGEEGKARYWLAIAHEEAVTAIQTRCATTGKLSVGKVNVPTKHVASGSRGLALIGAGVAGLAVFVVFSKISVGGGIVGAILLFGLIIVTTNLVSGAAKVGKLPGEAVEANLQRRYGSRLEAAQNLAATVDAMERFGAKIGVDQSRLPPYKLSVDQSALEISYLAAA